MSIFEVALESFIDMNHELVLSRQIEWEEVESEFAEYYCADNGRPSVDRYLEMLIAHKCNWRVKIVTGTPLLYIMDFHYATRSKKTESQKP